MSFNTLAALQDLATLVDGVSSITHVYTGLPESNEGRLIAHITIGGQEPQDFAGAGQLEREMRYRVALLYALDGNEQAAEEALAAAIDELTLALFARRRGAPESDPLLTMLPPRMPTDEPQYVVIAGTEFRQYPITVVISQQDTW